MTAAAPHGTLQRYRYNGCRCGDCRTANALAARDYRRRLAYNRTRRYVPAGPVREHVAMLRAAGIGKDQLAETTGIAESTIFALLSGRRNAAGERIPVQRLLASTAERLLAVRPDRLEHRAPRATVSGHGSALRLRALYTLGWTVVDIAPVAGVSACELRRILGGSFDVQRRTAERIRAAYDQLWDQRPPEETMGQRTKAGRARQRARRGGWAPPMALDDDVLDRAA